MTVNLAKSVFIGHISDPSDCVNNANSIAGYQVQTKIVDAMLDLSGSELFIAYSMAPHACWPKGPLITRSMNKGVISYLGYINLPFVRHLIFSLRLLICLLSFSPRLCVQYNSYLAENAALLIYRVLTKQSRLAIIIQDVHVLQGFAASLQKLIRSIGESISLYLARHYDIVVPISESIIRDFNFSQERSFVFQGGVTDFALRLMSENSEELEKIAVFAGGLEPHNGVDRLIEKWILEEIPYVLHIFGRGSLEQRVSDAVKVCDRIVFHGFQSEDVIHYWQCKAYWNICFRYSAGLNQEYFFPSKFVNLLCAPGIVVSNNFHALPVVIKPYICIVDEGISGLLSALNESIVLLDEGIIYRRRMLVKSTFSWDSCLRQIYELGGVHQRSEN